MCHGQKEGFFLFLTRDDAMFLVVERKKRFWVTAVFLWFWMREITNVGMSQGQTKRRNWRFSDVGSLIRPSRTEGRLRQSIWKYVWEMRLQFVSMNVWDYRRWNT